MLKLCNKRKSAALKPAIYFPSLPQISSRLILIFILSSSTPPHIELPIMEQSSRLLPLPGAAAAAAAADEPHSSAVTTRPGNGPVDVSSIQSSDLSSGFLAADQLVKAFGNFKKSGAPSRFLIFSEDAWVDIAHQVFDELKAGFLAGRTMLDVAADGKVYLFDFLGMSRIDSDTGVQNSIAWIDVNGRRFFPTNVADGNLSQAKKIVKFGKSPREVSDESMEVTSDRWPDAKMLTDDDRFYKVVEKLFLSGIKRFIPDTIITSIHRCSHSSPSANSRFVSFQLHNRATAAVRGNANVKFGWYGGDITEIMSCGFRQPNSSQLGLAAHGIGIHIASPHSPYDSALMSEADEDGEKHVVLCRVITGNSEKIEAGSKQDHPSNEDFDSGVDDTVNPKWFVIWSSHMNTHIIPEYVVSFKPSRYSQGSRKQHKLSSGTNLSFLKLFAEIERCLPSSKMQSLEILYKHYKVGKITRDIFIRYVRSIAGDKLLTSTIKRLRV